ncbi:hypothetical protein PMAYCL1PPCAC_07588, partial [Pristionchus mayeri]
IISLLSLYTQHCDKEGWAWWLARLGTVSVAITNTGGFCFAWGYLFMRRGVLQAERLLLQQPTDASGRFHWGAMIMLMHQSKETKDRICYDAL